MVSGFGSVRKGAVPTRKVGAIIIVLVLVSLVLVSVSGWFDQIGSSFVGTVVLPDP